jgi:DNA (cytosine-5)-methyltransferase 1
MAGLNPIFSIEVEPDASKTFRKNFPESHHFEEPIQNVTTEKIKSVIDRKEVHIISAGFPCQGFSSAGLRDPNDKRNDLYKEVVRITKELKPWFVVLENVPGIVSMLKGNVYKSIIREFAEIGYPNMSISLLESASYGVPQIRPRVIFIANRFGLKNPFPKPILKPEEFVPIEKAIGDLKDLPMKPDINHEWTKHSKEMEERLSKVHSGHSLYKSYYDAWKRQYRGVPSMTIKENHGGTHVHYELNRVLSAREMARLQSFPDDFIFEGRMKRVMWQVGNACPPLLFKHIGLALVPSLREIQKSQLR